MNKIIVGLGEILWDIFPDQKVLGGAPANFAYHVSQLGHDSYAVSSIGNDPLGREIMNTLREKKLNYQLDIINYPTGTVNVTLDDNGVPQYEIIENVAWDNIPFNKIRETLAKNCAAVCFGTLAQRNKTSRNTIRKFLKAVPDGCIKIFDINLRQQFYNKNIIEESLEIANILKLNEDEVKIVANLYNINEMNEQEICIKLKEQFSLDIVILTKGTNGSFVFSEETTSYLPTPKVNVVDTVGAGDSFTAAFISAYVNGKSIKEAHKSAVEVSADVCGRKGGMVGA